MKQLTVYDEYMKRVKKCINEGYGRTVIIAELQQERINIRAALAGKLLLLAGNQSPYPAREAKRQAMLCTEAINRIIKELEPKEIAV